MKTPPFIARLVIVAFTLLTMSAQAQVRVFDASHPKAGLDRLIEIDFENLPTSPAPSPPFLPWDRLPPNPLTIGQVTFADPSPWLQAGFCSSPTCTPDPDNPDGGNTMIALHPGGTISFAVAPRIVVLDIQGIGENPFELLVTDARGRRRRVRDQGVLFGEVLLGLSSAQGIRRIEVVHVGGDGGPLGFTRVLFSGPRHSTPLKRKSSVHTYDR